MKVLIIEDELNAYKNLKRMLHASSYEVDILQWIQSVNRALEWLENNAEPDLIFLDIQLGDGLCFEIFEKHNVTCPIIFTTAYEKYAIKAFEVNSIGYLLKPFNQSQLNKAINKYKSRLEDHQIQKLYKSLKNLHIEKHNYKERFHVKKGAKLIIIKTEDVAWFYRDEYVFLMTKENKRHIIDYSLDQLMAKLNPKYFYRLNRQFITHLDSIQKMKTLIDYKIKVSLSPLSPIEVIVAKDKSKAFKDWIG